ncbi:TetR/AcrR family transcriptional regulator [Ureibacillus sp. 179-F W5.1 NHS]|uniref:TetR/AcrR family transcriptional regulator n=1 Tax=Ureibacillus sp. 179-F W5.1 NHS TaxID=3374297 RepID=UPI0038794F2D
MSTKNNSNNKKEKSFIEKARRNQIVECAIETIAELGYAQASVSKIAKRANISKGVITYHFASKEELLEQVVIDYYNACLAYINPQFDSHLSPKEMLSKYIEANLHFISKNGKHVFAVIEIVANERTEDGKLRFVGELDERIFQPIEKILFLGMEDGTFREFTPFSARVMAVTIRNVIDGFCIELMRNPETNINDYVNEFVKIFELATRS